MTFNFVFYIRLKNTSTKLKIIIRSNAEKTLMTPFKKNSTSARLLFLEGANT